MTAALRRDGTYVLAQFTNVGPVWLVRATVLDPDPPSLGGGLRQVLWLPQPAYWLGMN